MYMNVKPNQHKRTSFNTSTMTSLGFIGPPKILGPPLNLALSPPKFNFLLMSLIMEILVVKTYSSTHRNYKLLKHTKKFCKNFGYAQNFH